MDLAVPGLRMRDFRNGMLDGPTFAEAGRCHVSRCLFETGDRRASGKITVTDTF